MAKIIMTCGKICVGKSTYAKTLMEEYNAVILSVDEITLSLFGQDAGENHDLYVERLEKYLYEKSLEIVRAGVNVVLDWGFWQKSERDFARNFYSENNVEYEFHYIEISESEWRKRIEKRNTDVLYKTCNAYYVDEGLLAKLDGFFEAPDNAEKNLVFVRQTEV